MHGLLLQENGANHLAAGLQANRWLTELKLDARNSFAQRLQSFVAITNKVHGCARRMQGGMVTKEELGTLLLECGSLKKATLVPTMLELGADPSAVDANGRTVHALLFGCPGAAEALVAVYRAKFVLDIHVVAAVDAGAKLQLFQQILMALAGEQWRSADATGRTVLHCLVDCCLQDTAIPDHVAVAAATAVLSSGGAGLAFERDAGARTASEAAAMCFRTPGLQRLLSVVVYDRFQLLSASNPLSAGNGIVVHRCADAKHGTSTNAGGGVATPGDACITMFHDEQAWRQQLDALVR